MASLSLRGETYHICFRWQGRQIHRSLDETNQNRAEALLGRLELQLQAVRQGVAAIPDGVDPIEWLLGGSRRSTSGGNSAIRTVGQLIDRYLDAMPEGSHATTTKRIDAIRFKHLKRVLGERTALQSISVETLQGYVKMRSKESARATTKRSGQPKKKRASRAKAQADVRTVGPSTIKKELSTLRTAWIWATDVGKAPTPPRFAKLKFPKEPEKEQFRHAEEIREILRSDPTADAEAMWECLVLTLPEVREIVAFVQEHWKHHPWFVDAWIIAAYTGARRSELCRMRAEDVDLKRGELTIRDKKRVRDKSEGKRVVQIANALEPTLRRLKGRGGHLIQYKGFRDERLATALTNQWINAQPKDSPWLHMRGFHVLRHSFASNLAASGEASQALIDSWMGHQTEEMRRRYRHFFPAEKRKAIKALG